MNNIQAIFITKNVYGNTLVYPANFVAKQLTKLTRKSTVDANDLVVIQELGYIVVINNMPVMSLGEISIN